MPLQTIRDFPVTTSPGVGGPLAEYISQLVLRNKDITRNDQLIADKNARQDKLIADELAQEEAVDRKTTLAAHAQFARDLEDKDQKRLYMIRAANSFPPGSPERAQIIAATQETDPDKFNLELTKLYVHNLGKPRENTEPVNQQFGGQVMLKDEGGNLFFATSKRDPSTGQVTPVLSPINHNNAVSGQLSRISGSGETPEERIENKVEEIRQTSDIEVATESRKASETTKAKTKEQRISQAIDVGIEAADAMAPVIRAVEILDSVQTGGFDNASLQAKRFFGIESADEAELSNLMGKAVLSQLRATFGAQFTAQEGAQLQRIEAGFGKSTAGNKRLLGQLRQLLEKKAKEGIRAAKTQGDDFTVERIENSLKFRLEAPGQPEQADDLSASERAELEALRRELSQ